MTTLQIPPLPPRKSGPSANSFDHVNSDENIDQESTSLSILNEDEDELSERELRELYDNEEIDRFLHLFSTYVTEVRVHETRSPSNVPISGSEVGRNSLEELLSDNETDNIDGEEWVTPQASEIPQANYHSFSACPPPRSFSEKIAFRYIIPILPPAPPPRPPFTIGRLRLTTQRLYLAVKPAYLPFFMCLIRLATWKDQQQSLIYCLIFWFLWYQNLLLPALFLLIFYALIKRRLFAYPTLGDLREHRREVNRAEEFGNQVQERLCASSVFGVREVWRLYRVFKKEKLKVSKGKGIEVVEDVADQMRSTTTVLDDTGDSKEEKDIKRALLHSLNDLADLHERVKNIFIWRRPASSRFYGGAIFLLFLLTLSTPAKYLAKLTYFVAGLFFWHIVPLIAAIPSPERARLPPPLSEVPTDAEYAMELISQRVAAGLPVKPKTKHKMKIKRRSANPSTSSLQLSHVRDESNTSIIDLTEVRDDGSGKSSKVDWKKWGERAAVGKAWAEDGRKLVKGGGGLSQSNSSPSVLDGGSAVRRNSDPEGTHTFPAQHNKTPGLITLTATTLFFTPILNTNASVAVTFKDLLAVKKTGLLKGISIRWATTAGEEKEEKFRWVGGRDELFALLIGADGKKWINS